MKHTVLCFAATALALGASHALAECVKSGYVESVRAYGEDTNNHIFVREQGVNSPLFVAHTRDANILSAALQAHVHRLTVTLTTQAAVCLPPSDGLWTNISAVTRIELAP